MRSTLLYVAACTLTVAVACQRTTVVTSAFTPISPAAVVYRDDGGGIQDTLHQVVRDQRSWEDLWQRATSTQPTPPSRPAIDFQREMIVAVAAGRMRPGDQIHVDSTGVQNDIYYVFVGITEACQRFEADVYPLEIVRVPKSDREVIFQSTPRKRAEGCT